MNERTNVGEPRKYLLLMFSSRICYEPDISGFVCFVFIFFKLVLDSFRNVNNAVCSLP